MAESLFILVVGSLLAGTILASVVAETLRLPALVLFLCVGMVAGSDGAGWINFDDYELARQIGTLALSLILFEGGLSTRLADLRPVLRPAIGLAVVGTSVTAALAGVAATVLLGLPLLHGLLLGSILASTDGAAIFTMLRASTLRPRVIRTLEGETGLNDPVAVLLVVGFIAWIGNPGYGPFDMAGLFVSELCMGAIAGVLVGRGAAAALRQAPLPTAGLYPVATLATAAIAYGAAASLHGSGFLAVYLAGLTLSNSAIPAQMTITIFQQGMAWFAQVALFLTLGLLVSPSQLGGVAAQGTLLALFIIFVARPAAVAAATALDRFSPEERAVLSWAGLRGGVPVVLATLPVIADVPGSLKFFNVVFFAVVVSTLLQGMTFESLARRLGVTVNSPAAPPTPTAAAQTLHATWSPWDGDPAHPQRLHGTAVMEHLRARDDAAGALVSLADGRLAITGPTLTVGSAAHLHHYAEERLAHAVDAGERAWWRELAATLGARSRPIRRPAQGR